MRKILSSKKKERRTPLSSSSSLSLSFSCFPRIADSFKYVDFADVRDADVREVFVKFTTSFVEESSFQRSRNPKP